MKHGFSMLAAAIALMTAMSAARSYVPAPAEKAGCTPCVNENTVCSNCGTGIGFTDSNGDGICDNCRTGAGFTDSDGDGICDNRGTGAGFTDSNGDGICDNRGTGAGFSGSDGNGGCDNQNFCGTGHGHGRKHGGGRNNRR